MAGTTDVVDRLMQGRRVYLLLALYFLLNIVLRLIMPRSLEMDEGQQLFLAQWLLPGYDSQPPFYNWLQYGVVQVFGDTVFSLTALKNCMLFCCYLLFGITAHRLIRDPRLAAVATLGLITIPQISFEAQRDLTHTVAVLFAACLFMLAFFRTLERPTLWNYALTGVAVGIGMLSKYNFVLLPLAALIAVLPDAEYRKRLIDPRLLLAIALALLIVLPHGLWFLDHVGTATKRTLGKLSEGDEAAPFGQILQGLGSLLGAAVAFVLPTLVLFFIAFGRTLWAARTASSVHIRLIGRMLLVIAVALVVLVIVGGASAIKPRWLVPFFFLLPLYLCLKVEASGLAVDKAPRRFGITALAIMVIVPAVLVLRVPFAGVTRHYEKQNVAYGPAMAQILASGPEKPALIVANDVQLAGNIRLHVRDIPVIVVPTYESLKQSFALEPGHPVLLVWRGRGEAVPALPRGFAEWLKGIGRTAPAVKDIALPYYFGRDGDAYHFGYAWAAPAAG